MSIWTELMGTDFAVKTVDAGGIPTRSLQAGDSGDVVLFLHGTSGHLEAFVRNIPAHAEHFRCHAIDMMGHGLTGRVNEPYEIPMYAKHVLDYLDAIGAEKAHLVGESLGGWVAAYIASDNPERVASLQLLAAGGTVANPEVMARIKASTLKAVQTDDRNLTRSRLELLMHDPVDVSDELVDIRHAIYHAPEFVAAIENLLSLQNMEIRQRNLLRPDRLSRIKVPTVVYWGHENPFGDVPEARKLAEDIEGAELVLYPECGHWPQHEQADLFNPHSVEFIAEHGTT